MIRLGDALHRPRPWTRLERTALALYALVLAAAFVVETWPIATERVLDAGTLPAVVVTR